MAITAVAAAASMGAVGAGIVAADTIAMVGIAASVVGTVTKNPALSKLGQGAALGGLGAGLAGLAPVAAPAAAPVAEALSQTPTAVPEALAQTPTAAPTPAAAPTPTAAPAPAPTNPGPTPYSDARQRGSANWSGDGSPAIPQNTPPAQAAPTNPYLQADNYRAEVDSAYSQTMASANKALSDTGSGGFMKWFDGLDKTSKLAAGQAAAGLISGVGKGALDYMGAQEAQKLKGQQQAYERSNLSGNAPKVGLLTNARTTRA